MPDDQSQPCAEYNALWLALDDTLEDTDGRFHADAKRLAHAVLDAVHDQSPDAVSQWYDERHPQPEREPEQQRNPIDPELIADAVRDAFCHGRAVVYADTAGHTHRHSLATPAVQSDAYRHAAERYPNLVGQWPVEHAAAHAAQQPEPAQEPECQRFVYPTGGGWLCTGCGNEWLRHTDAARA